MARPGREQEGAHVERVGVERDREAGGHVGVEAERGDVGAVSLEFGDGLARQVEERIRIGTELPAHGREPGRQAAAAVAQLAGDGRHGVLAPGERDDATSLDPEDRARALASGPRVDPVALRLLAQHAGVREPREMAPERCRIADVDHDERRRASACGDDREEDRSTGQLPERAEPDLAARDRCLPGRGEERLHLDGEPLRRRIAPHGRIPAGGEPRGGPRRVLDREAEERPLGKPAFDRLVGGAPERGKAEQRGAAPDAHGNPSESRPSLGLGQV